MADVVVVSLGPLLTLDEVKDYLKVEGDGEDIILGAFMDAAVAGVLQHCRIQTVPVGAEAVFKVAALLLLSDLYSVSQEDARLRSESVEGVGSRSFTDLATISGSTKIMIDRLLMPHRHLRV